MKPQSKIITNIFTPLSLLSLTSFLMIGCVIEEEQCATPDTAQVCQEQALSPASEEECNENEAMCTEVEITLCGEPLEILCTEESEPICDEEGAIDPQDICQVEGLILASEEECINDPTCRTITSKGPCDTEVTTLCRVEECTDDVYPDPTSICESEGLILANDDECLSNDECQSVTFSHPCGQATPVLCKPAEILCDAYPSCPNGFIESESLCLRGEEECQLATECQRTISCRPEVNCAAIVECMPEELSSNIACEADEENCRADSICGSTIFCRMPEECRAAPACEEDQMQSSEPCLATESEDECRANTLCGTTIVCR